MRRRMRHATARRVRIRDRRSRRHNNTRRRAISRRRKSAKRKGRSIVLYHRPSCPACRAAKPKWDAYKQRYPHKRLIERNTEGPDGVKGQKHGIQYVPSLLVVEGPEERVVKRNAGEAFEVFLEREGARIP